MLWKEIIMKPNFFLIMLCWFLLFKWIRYFDLPSKHLNKFWLSYKKKKAWCKIKNKKSTMLSEPLSILSALFNPFRAPLKMRYMTGYQFFEHGFMDQVFTNKMYDMPIRIDELIEALTITSVDNLMEHGFSTLSPLQKCINYHLTALISFGLST